VTVLQWIRKRFRTIFLCAVLELGALAGVPMRPEEIRELLQTMNQPKVAHVLRETDDDSEIKN
jgi:hypothetical protein